MYGDKHANKHKAHQILFLLFAKQKHICININTSPPLIIKQGKHAYILNTSPPFCQSSTKGLM